MIERLAGLRERIRPYTKKSGYTTGGVVVIGALVAGVLFGDGIARTVVNTSDGSTWLADDQRGDVVQINPSTGKAENRLHVSPANTNLEIRQRDGLLVVIDRSTGVVSLIDLATLLTTGRRQTTPGDATEVLLDKNRTYLADRDKGTITNIDPVSGDTLGEEWRAPTGLADVGVDGASGVWAIDKDSALHKLNWSDDINRFLKQEERPVNGAGEGSALVAHDAGVTVLGPEGGVVVQVGTDQDRAIAVPGLRTPLRAAEASPTDLVPAAVEPTGTVVMVRGEEVLEVGVNGVRCEKPGRPAVLNKLIYVPCLGARKVIVLNENGRTARDDIITPEGGDPELVLDDGRIMVNVPGADTGILVQADGSTQPVATYSSDGTGSQTTPPLPSPPQPYTPDEPYDPPPPPSRDDPGLLDDVPIVRDLIPDPPPPPPNPYPTSPPPTTTTPPREPDPPTPEEVVPTAVTAKARWDGSVLVSWTPGPAKPARYNIFFRAGPADQTPPGNPPLIAQAPSSATSAVVNTLDPGTVGAFFVVAVPPGFKQGQQLPPSPLSEVVTTYTKPGKPADLKVVRALFDEDNAGKVAVLVQWTKAPENGRPVTKYVLTARTDTGFRHTLEVAAVRASFVVTCPQSCADKKLSIDVVAVNEAGPGEPGRLETTLQRRGFQFPRGR